MDQKVLISRWHRLQNVIQTNVSHLSVNLSSSSCFSASQTMFQISLILTSQSLPSQHWGYISEFKTTFIWLNLPAQLLVCMSQNISTQSDSSYFIFKALIMFFPPTCDPPSSSLWSYKTHIEFITQNHLWWFQINNCRKVREMVTQGEVQLFIQGQVQTHGKDRVSVRTVELPKSCSFPSASSQAHLFKSH